MSSTPEKPQLEDRIAIAEVLGGFAIVNAGIYVHDTRVGLAMVIGGLHATGRGFVRGWDRSSTPAEKH